MRLAWLNALVLPLVLTRQSAAAPPPTHRIWIDTDLSFYSDDAVAIQLLLRSPSVSVAGISAASGNVWSDQAAADTLRVLQDGGFAGVPVHSGLPPADLEQRRARFRSGNDRAAGMPVLYGGALSLGPVPPPPVPPPGGWAAQPAQPPAASEALPAAARTRSGDLEVVLLGPATNLARALASDPGLARRIARIYFYAGALRVPGNATPAAEFNAWFDPESADIVLRSGIPLILLPLDATRGLRYDSAWSARFRRSPNPLAAHVAEHIAHHQAQGGAPPALYDEVLAALILDPGLAIHAVHEPIEVVSRPGADYGHSRPAHDGRPPVEVVYGVDRARLLAQLESALMERP